MRVDSQKINRESAISEPRRRSWLTISVVTILLLPALYVASFGPACWMLSRGVISLQLVATMYGPLIKDPFPLTLQRTVLMYGEACSDTQTVINLVIWANVPDR
jgi:hypothetical protein